MLLAILEEPEATSNDRFTEAIRIRGRSGIVTDQRPIVRSERVIPLDIAEFSDAALADRPNVAGGSRVEDWRADLRLRWVFHRFRGGPQSGSHHHVSRPPPHRT